MKNIMIIKYYIKLCRPINQVAKEEGLERIIITCNPDNHTLLGKKVLFSMMYISTSEYLDLQVKLPQGIFIRQFNERDFPLIKNLYEQEGWMPFINREHDALQAWKNSTITLVALDGNNVVGLVRALSDGKITTYIAEIIVNINYRGKGIGKALLEVCHDLYLSTRFDLLSSENSNEFYKNNKFRIFTGFRKNVNKL